jgi:hypothetical protein
VSSSYWGLCFTLGQLSRPPSVLRVTRIPTGATSIRVHRPDFSFPICWQARLTQISGWTIRPHAVRHRQPALGSQIWHECRPPPLANRQVLQIGRFPRRRWSS